MTSSLRNTSNEVTTVLDANVFLRGLATRYASSNLLGFETWDNVDLTYQFRKDEQAPTHSTTLRWNDNLGSSVEKIFSQIIQNRINLGLPLDSSVYEEFEKQTKHFNFAFAFGIDFIHEFFNFDNRTSKNYSNYLFKFIDKNRFINNFFSNYADKGSVL